MKKKEKLISLRKKNCERGYTLLEYTAGAAIILTIIWGALTALGTNMDAMLTEIGEWAIAQSQDIDTCTADPTAC